MGMFAKLYEELNNRIPSLELRSNEPMSRHTTFRIGGPVPLMAFPKTAAEAAETIRTAMELEIRPFFLGNGSNLLVADEGAELFVLKPLLNSLRMEGEDAIYAETGTTMAQTASFARDHSLTGLEFAHGIPGSLGGAVFMNAGAYGGEMAQVVVRADCVDPTGSRQGVSREQLEFGYRSSAFSDGRRLITGALLQLRKGDPDRIRDQMAELMEQRRSKQPLELPSAGSVFKRPEGYFAGTLIEQCGLKGRRLGGAQISTKHAGFIVNTGGATCADVLGLIRAVQETVFRQTGVELEPEIRMVGIAPKPD